MPRKPRELKPQHRQFAAMVAAGRPAADAYRVAMQSKGNPATCGRAAKRLMVRPEIVALVDELKQQAAEIATRKAGITREWVTNNLKTIVERCMQGAPVLDRRGERVYIETPDGQMAAAWTFDAKGANQALALLGKDIGMFVERHEHRHGPLANHSDAELDAMIATQLRELSALTGQSPAQLMRQAAAGALAIDVTPRLPAAERSTDPPPPGGGS